MKTTGYVPPEDGATGEPIIPPNLGDGPANPGHKRKGKEGDSHADGGGKPVIQIVAGEVSRIVDQIEKAVIAADLGLYQHNGCVARIETAVIAMPDAPKRNTLIIRIQEAEALREALCKAASFMRYDKRDKEWIACDPPIQRAKDLIARHERMRLPVLTGVMSSPLILPVERRIIREPGYDAGTGLFFEPLGATFPPVPERPTQEDAQAALGLLRTLLAEFPFADGQHGADESVMLSAIISAIMRPAIGNTPLHAFNAPVARTGKSLAATLVSVISQGLAPPLCTAGKTEEELEKRIDAMLLESPPFFLIDNIAHPLESAALCVLLTQEEKSIRPLGTSTIQEVIIRPFVECTGNNLVLVGDLASRAIRCTLNAKCEQPEFREIKRPALLRDVKNDRGRYVVAALTIVQAFIRAGAPPQSVPLGSFEKWSLYIRDPLIWIGCADPCKTMETIRKENPKRNDLSMVMCAWSAVFGAEYRTVGEATADAVMTYGGALIHKDLHDALMQVAGDRRTISGRRLAWWLKNNKEAVVDGRYFTEAGTDHRGVVRWALQDLTKNGGPEQKTK